MNSVNLIGRLTADPRRHNKQVYLTVAVDRHNKEGKADFIPVAVHGSSADSAEKYLAKGDLVGIPGGRLQSYRDGEGNNKYIVSTGFVEYLRPKRDISEQPPDAREEAENINNLPGGEE